MRFHSPLAVAVFALAVQMASSSPSLAQDAEVLLKQLKSGEAADRIRAAGMLAELGRKDPGIVRALAEAIKDEDPRVQRAAIRALAAIRPGADVVVPLMSKVLAEAEPPVAISAVGILAEFGADAIPFVLEAMKDDRARYWAILVLSDMGADAAAAVPELVKYLADEQPEVRREVVIALGNIGSAAKAAIPDLTRLLGEQDKAVKLAAAFALGKMGPAAKNAAGALRLGLKSEDPFERIVSAWALAAVSPENLDVQKQVVPLLVGELTAAEDREIRIAAARALVEMQPDHRILLPNLEQALEKATPEMVQESLAAIASLGVRAVPGLVRMMRYQQMRPMVADVLGRIGPEAAPAVPVLTEALADSGPVSQREILLALGNIGPAAAAGAPEVMKFLAAENDEIRYSAIYALGKMGPPAKLAAPALQEYLKNEDPFYRMTAAWALVRIDPEGEDTAKLALPPLVEALKHPRSFVRIQAAETIGALGPRAASALPALKEAAQEGDEAVREAVAMAVKKIR